MTGMECPDCEDRHGDWQKNGSHAVADAHNVGTITRWECGRCSATVEVPTP